MRYLRSSRFSLLIWFILAVIVFISRWHSLSRENSTVPLKILSERIDRRLHLLREHFAHVNLSLLLERPASRQSPTITYRCREWCGGCKCLCHCFTRLVKTHHPKNIDYTGSFLSGGDRLRGITSTFILAVLTQRHFYIDMPYPCELRKFLQPHLYDWQPIEVKGHRREMHIQTTLNGRLADQIYQTISSTNFPQHWAEYDDIYVTTNSDYITPVLINPHLRDRVRQLNFTSAESTQARLFPLIYELLFRPTDEVTHLVDQILVRLRTENSNQKHLICLHLRQGKNPTIVHDKKLPHRDTMLDDVLQFLEKNLTDQHQSMIFITSDSAQINQRILDQYGPDRALAIPGPIIHIDRLSPTDSIKEQCQGFLKVVADFYVLGECDTLIMARSGFSQWASRRRPVNNAFDRLYLYCRGVHRVTGHQWRRPHTVC